MCFHIENNIHLSPILHEVFPLDSYEEQSLCKHKGLYNCWALLSRWGDTWVHQVAREGASASNPGYTWCGLCSS